MTAKARTARYGAAAVLIVAGVVCGGLISGTIGGTLATVLIGLGLVLAVSLVFYEVGLTEDRDRAAPAEGEGRAGPADPLSPEPSADEVPTPHTQHPAHEGAPRRPPDRMRGHRRRLR